MMAGNADMKTKKKRKESVQGGADDTVDETNMKVEVEKKRKKGTALPSSIKNKEKRSSVHAKLKRYKKIEKRKRVKARDAAEKKALELGEVPPPWNIPRTIDNTKEADDTACRPDDEELFADNDADEFNSILNRERTPKTLITTSRFHSTRGPAFIEELLTVIPNAHYHERGTYDLKKNHRNPTSHKRELILAHFTTRLGHRITRLIASLFPQDPNFGIRQVVTFHNQRDFIFFRYHRYIFGEKKNKDPPEDGAKKLEKISGDNLITRLQECGPRFTLKLVSLQRGTFDSKSGEYEWVHKPETDTSRRRFFL